MTTKKTWQSEDAQFPTSTKWQAGSPLSWLLSVRFLVPPRTYTRFPASSDRFQSLCFFFLNYRSYKPCSSYPSLLLLHSVHHTDRQRRLTADRHVTATGGAGGPLALRSHSVPRNEIHRQPPSRPVPWCFLGARIHDDCCSFHIVTFGHSIISFSNVPPWVKMPLSSPLHRWGTWEQGCWVKLSKVMPCNKEMAELGLNCQSVWTGSQWSVCLSPCLGHDYWTDREPALYGLFPQSLLQDLTFRGYSVDVEWINEWINPSF